MHGCNCTVYSSGKCVKSFSSVVQLIESVCTKVNAQKEMHKIFLPLRKQMWPTCVWLLEMWLALGKPASYAQR